MLNCPLQVRVTAVAAFVWNSYMSFVANKNFK